MHSMLLGQVLSGVWKVSCKQDWVGHCANVNAKN